MKHAYKINLCSYTDSKIVVVCNSFADAERIYKKMYPFNTIESINLISEHAYTEDDYNSEVEKGKKKLYEG